MELLESSLLKFYTYLHMNYTDHTHNSTIAVIMQRLSKISLCPCMVVILRLVLEFVGYLKNHFRWLEDSKIKLGISWCLLMSLSIYVFWKNANITMTNNGFAGRTFVEYICNWIRI